MLYLSNLKDAERLATANPFRITAVSVCAEEVVRRAEGVTYAHIPIADSRPISAQRFDEIMGAIEKGIRRGNLLVHCVGGSSRSPIILAGMDAPQWLFTNRAGSVRDCRSA